MKNFPVLISFILLSFSAYSQTAPYTPMKGLQITYAKVDSGFAIPVRDTVLGRNIDRPGLFVIRPQDSLLYYYTGSSWSLIQGTGGDYSQKVDSVTISGDYLFYWINGVSYGYLLPTAGWGFNGNPGCDGCVLGTTGNHPIRFIQFDTLRAVLDTAGYFGIGNQYPDAILDVSSTSSGVLIPRMSAGDMGAIAAPVNGMMVFNTTADSLYYYNAAGEWWPVGSPVALATPSLQEVTDVGNTTTNNILIDPGLGNSLDLGSDITFNQAAGSRVGLLTKLSQTGNHVWSLPNKTGTIALTNDIPDSWLTTGNSGTTAGTNFIGTTDDEDLVFKRNGVEMLRLKDDYVIQLETDPTNTTRSVIQAGPVGFPAIEGSVTFAIGADPRFEINSGENNYFDFWTDAAFRFYGHSADTTNILSMDQDSVIFNVSTGNYKFKNIASGVGTKAVRIDPSTGLLTYADTTSGGGGSGTVNSGTQYRLGYYATTGTAISEAAAITANRALISDANGVPTHSATTATELGYVSGVTSAIQTQINAKVTSASSTANQIAYITGANTISGRTTFTDDGATITMAPTTTTLFNSNSGSIAQFQRNAANTSFTQTDIVQPGGSQASGDGFSLIALGSSYSTLGSFEADAGWLGANGGLSNGLNIVATNASAGIKFYTGGYANQTMAINSAGAVRMNTYGAGTATFDASGNISSVSDTRLKTNIKPYRSGVDELMKLRTITYQWNDKSGMETKGTYAGFSAQNVKEAIPLGTGENKDGYLSLQERAIIATLVNVAQEQQREIEKLKKEIKKLKKK